MLLWLLILVFISFFVGFFCAGWYVIFYCLTACIPALKVNIVTFPTKQRLNDFFQDIADLLLTGAQFPFICADKMVSGAPLF